MEDGGTSKAHTAAWIYQKRPSTGDTAATAATAATTATAQRAAPVLGPWSKPILELWLTLAAHRPHATRLCRQAEDAAMTALRHPSLSLLSLNVNGLGALDKRRTLFKCLQEGPWQIIVLLHTPCKPGSRGFMAEGGDRPRLSLEGDGLLGTLYLCVSRRGGPH